LVNIVQGKSDTGSNCPPILFLIFNRPDLATRVFESIRSARPNKLYIAADGPRPGNEDDKRLCAETREVVKNINWDCEVHTNFRDKNLGCKIAISSATTWFFENVQEGIILEDDCFPEPTFFRFCKELLEIYRDDQRVMTINGTNFQFGRKYGKASYYFTRYPHVWGWASWRRAWKYYDVDMNEWATSNDQDTLLRGFSCKAEQKFWRTTLNKIVAGKIDTWDFQWAFACFIQNGLCIVPNVNLITNIGFRSDSTHTRGVSVVGNIPNTPIVFPLFHPKIIMRNIDSDEFVGKLFFTSCFELNMMLFRRKYNKNIPNF
jgi:hypothetical protein